MADPETRKKELTPVEKLEQACSRISQLTIHIAELAGARTLWALEAGQAKQALKMPLADPKREEIIRDELYRADIPGLSQDAKEVLAEALIYIATEAEEAAQD